VSGAQSIVTTSTIQLSTEIKRTLESMKVHPRETFNDVLERLVEDVRELDRQTLAEVEEARAEIRAGKYLTQDQVRKAMGLG
jgi:predicted transcriptional regulator